MSAAVIRKLPLAAMLESCWKYRALTARMTVRQIVGRYRGSMLGVLWSLLNPLVMLVVYTFVFTTIFNARWGQSSGATRADFALVLYAGMLVHGLLADCLIKAPVLILENANYVKKVIFPLEILPLVNLGASLFNCLIGLCILLAAQLMMHGHLPWTALLLPVVLLPVVVLCAGISWALAALGVYLRDIAQVSGLLSTLLLFLSPVLYPVSSLPPGYRGLVALSPIAFPIEQVRGVLLYGTGLDWAGWALYSLLCLVGAWIGFICFQKTRMGFADVI